MTAAGWNLRHGKAEREHLDESDSAARFIDAAEADPWQNGRRVGQQRFGGNVAEEEAAARFGAQHAVPKSTPTEQTKEALGVFILACLVETAFKLHAPGTTEYEAAQCVSQNPTVQALRDDCVFQAHHRCEPNYGLDSGALACLEKALPYDELARAKIGFFKAIICPHDGMLDELEAKHRELASKSPWEGDVCAQKLLDALRSVTLDIAYAGMRRSFFEAEARRQKKSPGQLPLPSSGDKKAESGLWQKTLFTNYYVHLCNTDSFGIALGQFAGGTTPLQRVLEETLLVQTSFHRMLVAREYSFLLANVPDNAGELVVSVGGGAAKLVRECAGKEYAENRTYTQQVLLPDLRALHAAVSVDLDKRLVDAVCPRGWMLDHTEHACCEKRRLDDAKLLSIVGKGPKRKRVVGEAADKRQAIRCRRLRSGPPGGECWRILGFASVPSNALLHDS